MSPMKLTRAIVFAAAGAFVGCAGDIGTNGPGGEGSGEGPRGGTGEVASGGRGASNETRGGGSTGGGGTGAACTTRRPSWQMSLHTVHQVRTIVEQVFGPTALADGQVQSLLANLPADLKAKGFDTENKIVSPQYVDAYIRLAGRLAALASTEADVRGAIEEFAGQPCMRTTELESPCGLELAKKLAGGVWRQPVTDAEADALLAAYKANKAKHQAAKAYAGLVASVLLGSKSALRFDAAERSGSGKIDANTLGARLALTLTSGLPDVALRAKMKDGTLAEPEVLRAEAKRLLRTPRGRATLGHFAEQWLNLSLVKSPPGRAGFVATDADSALVAEAARAEVGKLFESAVLEGKKTLEGFYATEEVVPSHDWLAKIYGTPKGSAPARAPAARRGLLTRAGFHLHGAFADWLPLAHRGYGVKVTMLCGSIGAFPDSVDTTLPATAPDVLSSRQYFETLTERGTCQGCHAAMNPWSYPLSGFSVTGELLPKEQVRNRKTGQMVAVDVRQTVTVSLDGKDVPIRDATELSAAIGASEEARACFATRLDQYAVGVANESHCGVDATLRALGGKGTLEDAIVAYVGSPAFALR